MRMKIYALGIAALLAFSAQARAETYSVKSPDGRIEASVDDGAGLSFSLKADGKVLLEKCAIGMDTDRGFLGRDAVAQSQKLSSHKGTLEPVFGTRKTVDDEYNQLELGFKNFKLLVRVYDEAAAYRFSTDFDGELVVNGELLELSSVADSDNTIAHVVQADKTSFERRFLRQPAAALKKQHSASLPFFFEKSGMKVAVVESAWLDYPGMRISYPADAKSPKAYFTKFPKKLGFAYKGKVGGAEYDGMYVVKETEDFIAKTSGARAFPWRGFVVGRTDADFADNDTVYKLAEPSRVADTSWIKIGTSVWDWWVDWNIENVDFELGVNEQTYRHYIDFAAANGIPFLTIDAGWHVGRGSESKPVYNDTAHFVNGKPYLDVPAVVKYANSKGVKVVIWIYSKVAFDEPEKALDLYKSWGVYGLKIDFNDRDDQWLIRHFENITRLAAERKMVIDWHGCPAPSGFQRTYPNAVNFEAVYGGEVNKWSPAITPSHNIDLVFTRMLLGSMDYTSGGMRNRAKGDWYLSRGMPAVNGTRAHMAAHSVLFFEPLKMISDMPSEYEKEPEILRFLAGVPTSWDETKVLGGKMGEYVVVARRKGDVWYVGGMADWNGKKFELDLSKIIGAGKYKAELIRDARNSGRIATDYKYETKTVKHSDKLAIEMKSGGGFALKLIPIK